MEEWRNVPGSKGQYQIRLTENGGICRSTNYKGTGRVKEFSNTPNKNGRLYWNLQIEGRTVTYQAGRWIALTYPELVQNEYFEGAEIDHIDTNPLNNHPSNIRWVTRSGNLLNPETRKHRSQIMTGRKHSQETKEKMSKVRKGILLNRPDISRPVLQFTKDGTFIREYPSGEEAARVTGINRGNIAHSCTNYRNTKSAGGYVWRYKE